MHPQQTKIINGSIITPHRVLKNGTILITGNKITEVNEGNIDSPEAVIIDAGGKYVSPGFVDIHVHGGGGHDFMDCTEEAFLGVAKLHAAFGTTAITPTTLSCSREELLQLLEVYKQVKQKEHGGAAFIGMHLEGPYFAMNQRGAQDPRYIRNPDPSEYLSVLSEYGHIIKRWSAAPELPGALDFADVLKTKNILAALAHTDAIYEEVLKGFEHGYKLATHLYSGMLGVTRRDAKRYAGAVEAAFLIDEMTVEVIADGEHLPGPLLQLVYKIKGPDKIALITDAMRGAGMPEGESILGSKHNGLKVIIEDGVAKLPDRTAFAGSVATADRLVRNMIHLAGVPLADAVKMMTSTPAAIMGITDRKGSLEAGKDADIVIFDDQINVSWTMVGGKVVYNGKVLSKQPTTMSK
ncbi:MAG TPA: N-acetylglucosamine-6-phosphate deacetylase [Mucilaginibacter sp.]|jgi:N-acetylglucosamine-6-phosphate deacetylase